MASNIPDDNVILPSSWRAMAPMLVAAGAVGVLASLGLSYFVTGVDGTQVGFEVFFRSYLANFAFCLSFCLGALFFVMVQHLVRSGWSATVRRIAELYAYTIPWWALLFLPVLAMVLFTSSGVLYPWNAGAGNVEPIVESKLPFLNPFWFTVRVAVYFAVWIFAARWYFQKSRQQDESGDIGITLQLQKWAGPLIMAFALALNFGSFDMFMSTDPAWFSTIYGVYLFAAGMLSFFAVTILTCYLLQRNGRLQRLVNLEHYQDLSKFQFGFIVFWAYIAFSQYMLYWYGNIPEETLWYKHRMEHGWGIFGIALLVCHFVIPFLGTASRYVRRTRGLMACWAVFILFAHWLDMTFLIMPSENVSVSFMLLLSHLVCWLGMVSLFVALFLLRVGETPMVAAKDPWLPDALAYQVGP